MDPFEDRVAIVTGGASGIGRALGEALARRGASVVLADLAAERAHEVAAAIEAAGGRASAAACDVTDPEAVARVVRETVAAHGRLDLMFNNAGIAVNAEVKDMTLEHWNRTFDVNIRGVVHGIAAAYPVMIEQGHGAIVNTASVAGLVPAPGIAAYVASKHAVVGLSTTLRAEAAAYGVRVHVVCPGFVDTPIINAHMIGTDEMKARSDDALKRLRIKLYPPERCARDILAGIVRDAPIIPVTPMARPVWWAYRLWPSMVIRTVAREFKKSYRGKP